MNRTLKLFAGILAATLSASAFAQGGAGEIVKPSHPDFVFKTYFLSNAVQQQDANEILIALRNMLEPSVKIYLVSSENAIELSAPPDQQVLAQKILSDLDRPRKVYRLTFTLAESDSGKRVGIQHFSILVAGGQRTVLKQGDKIPVATGTYGKGSDPLQTQFQYLDIGISVDATLTDSPDGLQLKSKIEQSSLGQPSTIAGVQEPVIRQTVLEGTSAIKVNKPLALGGLDIESSTRHMDIEVVAEPVS
jgi:type II secretory pathway component GspD/PulD (secretin)